MQRNRISSPKIASLASFTANVEALFNALYLAFRSRTSSTGLNLSDLISEDGRHLAAELDCFKGSGCGGVMLGDACSSMPSNWRLIGVSGILDELVCGTAFLAGVDIHVEGPGAGS